MTVLVVGGTGYIAGWCIKQLQESGHEVRTTVRDLSRAHAGVDAVVADLMSDDGWNAALDGVQYVIHPASPLGGHSLVETARDGALRVLRAATDAGVARVVLTSAANASSPTSYRTPGVTDETLWTDPDAAGLDEYRRSKTLAERAAWDFVASEPSVLTTVLPGAVVGPILTTDGLGSVQVIGRLLRGEMPRVPNIGLEIVDVRDVADLHIRAMLAPEAAGQRFLGTGELVFMPKVARWLRDELGVDKVPTKSVPDVALKLMARRRPDMRGVLPGLGRRNVHSTAKAARLLAWTPRPARDAVLDCARSLIEHGVA